VNIGLIGLSGVGKSSYLNHLTGGTAAGVRLAEAGECETTDVPEMFPLSRSPAISDFRSQLPPKFRWLCEEGNVKCVNIWDLPGFGTQRHPLRTYVNTKSLLYFDYIIVIVGCTVLESETALIKLLQERGIAFVVIRSKFDDALHGWWRRLDPDETMKEQALFEAGLACARKVKENMAPKLSIPIQDLFLVVGTPLSKRDPLRDVKQQLMENRSAHNRIFSDIMQRRFNLKLKQYLVPHQPVWNGSTTLDPEIYGCIEALVSQCCCVCMEAEADVTIDPCGHMCACGPCLEQLQGDRRKCPLCRIQIAKVIRTFR